MKTKLNGYPRGSGSYPSGMPLKKIIPLARAVVQELGKYHNRRLYYGRLQPEGIIPAGSAALGAGAVVVRLVEDIGHNPAYMAPEQSGRLGVSADHRSDFYSLGLVLLELFTGKKPYQGASAAGMIQAHLTASPLDGEGKQAGKAAAFLRFLSRLLEKNPEDRYQCCFDIMADLDALEDGKEASGPVLKGGRIRLPQAGFARQRETAFLQEAEKKAQAGRSTWVSLTGEAGSGKTSLVRHAFRDAAARGAVFVSGKFDPLHPRPHQGIHEAVRDLVTRTLGKGDEDIRGIRARLAGAIPFGRTILLNLFPEAAPFIEEEGTASSGLEEVRNLTGYLVPRFFAAFTEPGHPVVLFLDDLQWAEEDSLLLVRQLVLSEVPGLLLVLAWRNTGGGERLSTAAGLFKGFSGEPPSICLTPFTARQTRELLSMVFPSLDMDSKAFSALVYVKSRGNPLFIRLYLQSLEEEGLLHFDHLKGSWGGDLRKIAEAETSSDVVDFLITLLEGRPEEEKKALMLAACLGVTFETGLLSKLLSHSPEETLEILSRPLEEGLLLRSSPGEYAFLHDRVRQASLALMNEPERLGVHRTIGGLLEKHRGDLFGAVHHYHQALETFNSREDRMSLKELNREAAALAKKSAAFDLFHRCMQTALILKEPDVWEADYSAALSLFTDAAEAALLVSDHDTAETCADEIRQHSRDVCDGLAAADIRIRSLMARHRMEEAFEVALGALGTLGCRFPRRFLPLHGALEKARTGLRLRKTVLFWKNLPPMTGPRELGILKILMDGASSSYIAVPDAFPLVACFMVNLHLKKGWTGAFAFSLSLYSNILMDRPGKGNLALRLDRVIDEIIETGRAGENTQKILFFSNSMCRVWLGPLERTLEPLNQGFEKGREQGDFEYALLCGQFFYLHSIFCCRRLDDLHEGLSRCTSAARELSQTRSVYGTSRLMQFYLNLTGKNPGGSRLCGDSFREDRDLAHLEEVNDRCGLGTVRIYKMILALLLEEYQEAVAFSDEAAPHIPALRGEYLVALWVFHAALARAALGGKDASRRLGPALKKLKVWSRLAPENFLHQYYMIMAERNRLEGRYSEAARLCQAAVTGAESNRFFLDAALARERLWWCFRDQGRIVEAEEALGAARDAFREYGCLVKVNSLEEKYPGLKNRRSGPSFDAGSVVEAARAISGEMVPKRLAERLLAIVMENSGATRGILFLMDREELKPEAQGVCDGGPVRITHDPGAVPFPGTVLRYVRRTGETVTLTNGAKQMPYGADPYLVRFRILSVLCVPLIHRNDLKGLLYLENHRLAGAFTPGRAQLAGAIAAQAAVSLENARLYQSLLEDMAAREAAEKEVLAAKERERDHQRQLMEADKLASLGMLAAGVAHEVNNPNHIVGLNAALLESAGPDILSLLDEAVGDDTSLLLGGLEYSAFRQRFPRLLSDIRDCSERIDTIARELKNYAGQPSHGPREPVDMNTVTAAALRLCHPLTRKATNHLSFLPGKDLPPVYGMASQLEQVVINLIQNACHALTSPEQAIGIETGRDEETGGLVLTVSDEGRGIPSGLTDRILEPFFTTRRDSGGTGLGLSVSRKIVKEHGGTLDIASEEDQGTTITITLPPGEIQ